MARMISAVTANFGTAERKRSMLDGIPAVMGGEVPKSRSTAGSSALRLRLKP